MYRNKILVAIAVLVTLISIESATAYQPPLTPNAIYTLPKNVSSARYELSINQVYNNNPKDDISNDHSMMLAADGNKILAVTRKGNLALTNAQAKKRLESQGDFIPKSFLQNTLGVSSIFLKGLIFVDKRVFTSFVYDDPVQKCGKLVLLSMSANYAKSTDATVFGINPKIIYKSACDKASNSMWGGSLASDSSRIYLAIGDNRFDWKTGKPFTNYYSSPELIPSSTDFGKVLCWELSNQQIGLEPTVFARGFRNPLGMVKVTQDSQTKIVLSDFGPEGGDELNILERGVDYGWPNYNLGRVYDLRNPSINGTQGTKWGNFSTTGAPMWSWIVSANPTQLIQVPKNSDFKDWRGQLLVATLSGKIERVVLNKWKVIGIESIYIGTRMRSIAVDNLGAIWVSSDDGKIFTFQTSN